MLRYTRRRVFCVCAPVSVRAVQIGVCARAGAQLHLKWVYLVCLFLRTRSEQNME